MRWDKLFADLDAQAESEALREREAEVADRTRYERAQIDVQARLLACQAGPPVTVRFAGRSLTGVVRDVGADWVLLETGAQASVLVAMPAVRVIDGVAQGAVLPSAVAKRFGLGLALRGISRDRAVVEVVTDGMRLTGTIDVVGADHLEMAEHPPDLPRRARHVTAVRIVPFWALESVHHVRP